jgi:hypothetical protein
MIILTSHLAKVQLKLLTVRSKFRKRSMKRLISAYEAVDEHQGYGYPIFSLIWNRKEIKSKEKY